LSRSWLLRRHAAAQALELSTRLRSDPEPLGQRNAMRIYVFKSSSTARLRAFAGDPDINNLPRQHGPWVVTGVIAPGATPPHNFSREAIEKAITASGFQLWRLCGG
jgi:hypothetical protein